MIKDLFLYQKHGAEWLSKRSHALLADEMGLGKTAQAITAADMVGAKRIMVLCPASVRVNWEREFAQFSREPREFHIVQTKTPNIPQGSSVICSYDLAGDIPDSVGTFDLLILDEAHYLKSYMALRTVTVLGRKGWVHKAKRTWALSGTPAPNHAGELWPLLYTFGVTKMPFEAFIENFCDSYAAPFGGQMRRQITGTKVKNIPILQTMLSSVMLRRKKEDVMTELPPITYENLIVEPGEVDLTSQNSFVEWFLPTDRTGELLEKINKERELVKGVVEQTGFGRDGMKFLEAMSASVSSLRRYTGLQKVDPVGDIIIDELERGEYDKLVIFAIHRDVIEGLRVKLRKFGAVTLYGGTSPEARTRHIDRFQNRKSCKVFIGNITAAGVGITLTAAHNVMFVEQDWVPGNNAQAAMRCHRIGQEKPVFVRFAGVADSIDEKIAKTLRRKTEELTQLFEINTLQGSAQDDSSLI